MGDCEAYPERSGVVRPGWGSSIQKQNRVMFLGDEKLLKVLGSNEES